MMPTKSPSSEINTHILPFTEIAFHSYTEAFALLAISDSIFVSDLVGKGSQAIPEKFETL